MHMHESHDHTMSSVGVIAFFGENHLLTPVLPNEPKSKLWLQIL